MFIAVLVPVPSSLLGFVGVGAGAAQATFLGDDPGHRWHGRAGGTGGLRGGPQSAVADVRHGIMGLLGLGNGIFSAARPTPIRAGDRDSRKDLSITSRARLAIPSSLPRP
ncbi:hypothetical protein [Streptomyces sp. NBC_00120]|uniref:hypothetical protein n=1 Tax=Streptomyces sp. NBC_00120 TaxID=2975660 RepID=UPI00224DACBC|nr:hypothetical protein [Streptomyces sp. NBC_00120]MCX5323450.1 hypothetical protein [Streptomyces sp. NBC_00120]